MTARDIIIRVIVFIICLIFSISAYKTKDLDGVKDASIYRMSYALLIARGITWFATEILRLWEP